MVLLLALASPADAVTWEVLEARLAEVAPLRETRLATAAPPITVDEYKAAANGEIPTNLVSVADVAAKKAYGLAVFDVSVGKLWAAINDDVGKVERTRLSFGEVLAGKPCSTPRTVFQYLPTPIVVSDRWWVSDFAENKAAWDATGGRVRELQWASNGNPKPTTGKAAEWAESGIAVAWTKGAWLLIDIDGSNTLVEYYTWSDPGGNLPAGPVSSFSSSGVADTVQVMADLAKAGPSCPIR